MLSKRDTEKNLKISQSNNLILEKLIKVLLYFAVLLAIFPIPKQLYLHVLNASALFLVLIVNFLNKRVKLREGFTAYTSILLVWLLMSGLSILYAESKILSLQRTLVLYTAIIYTVAINVYIRDRNILDKIIKIFVISNVVHIVISLFEILTHKYLFTTHKDIIPSLIEKNNPISFFNNPNDLSIFLLFSSLMIFFLSKNILTRYAKWTIITLNLFLMFKSKARLAILTLMIAIAAYIFYKIRSYKWRKTIVYFAYVAVIGLALLAGIFVLQILDIESNDISLMQRLNYMKNGFLYLRDTNGFGIGAGNIPYYFENKPYYNVYGIFQMHNWWIETMVEYGVFFFALYFVWYIKSLFKSLKGMQRHFENEILGFTTVFYTCFVIAAVVPSTIYPFMWVWIINALVSLLLEKNYRFISD